jgi:hypothetical protein
MKMDSTKSQLDELLYYQKLGEKSLRVCAINIFIGNVDTLIL